MGQDDINDVEALQGLLAVPSLTNLDMKDNYLSDPAILPEIFEKLPNLTLLQTKGNSFRDNIKDFRKTMIARLPKLQYLDERPVTEDDRRRAHAFAEGKLPAERVEIKVIKEEKEE